MLQEYSHHHSRNETRVVMNCGIWCSKELIVNVCFEESYLSLIHVHHDPCFVVTMVKTLLLRWHPLLAGQGQQLKPSLSGLLQRCHSIIFRTLVTLLFLTGNSVAQSSELLNQIAKCPVLICVINMHLGFHLPLINTPA